MPSHHLVSYSSLVALPHLPPLVMLFLKLFQTTACHQPNPRSPDIPFHARLEHNPAETHHTPHAAQPNTITHQGSWMPLMKLVHGLKLKRKQDEDEHPIFHMENFPKPEHVFGGSDEYMTSDFISLLNAWATSISFIRYSIVYLSVDLTHPAHQLLLRPTHCPSSTCPTSAAVDVNI
jgi:hypothetical protein